MRPQRVCEWKLLLPGVTEIEIDCFCDFASEIAWLSPKHTAELLISKKLKQLPQYDAMRICG